MDLAVKNYAQVFFGPTSLSMDLLVTTEWSTSGIRQ
jgi:hypothetical protein